MPTHDLFGAGTDYALLLIARYREELGRVEDRHDAMAVAWRRAVPAIATSAATVTISLLCLGSAEAGPDTPQTQLGWLRGGD